MLAAVHALVVVRAAARRVVGRHRLLEIVGRVRGHRPVVAVGAHFGVHEEAVEQPEPVGERVMVHRDGSREEHEARIPVALRVVAEHLIVGAVFLDDVDHVLERRIARPRAARGPSVGRRHASRESRERVAARFRQRHAHHGAGDRVERILIGPADLRIRSARIGDRPPAFAARDFELVADDEQRRWIPSRRNSSGELVVAGRARPRPTPPATS